MDFLFLATVVLGPVPSMLLLRKSGYRLLDVRMPVVINVYYFTLSYVGLIPLYFATSEYHRKIGATNQDVVWTLCLGSILVMTLLNAGLLIFRWFNKEQSRDEFEVNSSRESRLFSYCLAAVSIGVTCLYFIELPKIPIIAALTDGFYEGAQARSLAGNAFQGRLPFHVYSLFFAELLPFVSLVFLCHWLRQRTLGRFLVSFALIGMSLLVSVALTEKSPIIWYFLMLMITLLLAFRVKLKLLPVLLAAGIGFVTLYFAFANFMQELKGEGIKPHHVINAVAQRLFMGNLTSAYFYFEEFPENQKYLEGRSFPDPKGILLIDRYPITLEIMDKISPELKFRGIRGSAPTVFWGELFANFGWIGLLALVPLVGLLLGALDFGLIRFSHMPIFPAVYAWVTIHYCKLAESGISNFIVDEKVLLILGFSLLMVYWDLSLKKKKIEIQMA